MFGIFYAVIVLLTLLYVLSKPSQYKKETYYQITKLPYSAVKHDKGRYPEYLTYKALRHFEDEGSKFLFNVFIPKRNGGTTEIDVLLINSKGLFVFECKNFSGWIFGDELQKNWTQTLPVGKGRCHKEYFYNPIKQNAAHIRHLQVLMGKYLPTWSIIVFSDRCEFKEVTVRSNTSVINHYKIKSVISAKCSQLPDRYTEIEINDIYNKLYPYSQAS